jgi:hypothetical protein
VTAFSPNHAPLHDPWLNPAGEHFGGCDGKCHAGVCEERARVLQDWADEDGEGLT